MNIPCSYVQLFSYFYGFCTSFDPMPGVKLQNDQSFISHHPTWTRYGTDYQLGHSTNLLIFICVIIVEVVWIKFNWVVPRCLLYHSVFAGSHGSHCRRILFNCSDLYDLRQQLILKAVLPSFGVLSKWLVQDVLK